MDWLTQNWVWIIVIAAGALLLLRRSSHHGFGAAGHHGYGAYGNHSGHGAASYPQGGGASQGTPKAAIDPVSGNAVKTEHAITSYFRGRVYFFENEDTRRRFEAEPERFATGASGVDPTSRDEHRHHRRHGC